MLVRSQGNLGTGCTVKTWPALEETAFRECHPHHQAGEVISVQQKGNVVGKSAVPKAGEPCQLKGFVQGIPTPWNVSSATSATEMPPVAPLGWAGFPGVQTGIWKDSVGEAI